MTNHTPQALLGSWRELYIAALSETDQKRVPTRIVDAEKAIVARARELFSAGADTIEEDQALDDALYALRALQNGLAFRASGLNSWLAEPASLQGHTFHNCASALAASESARFSAPAWESPRILARETIGARYCSRFLAARSAW
jgi:hypothetical protein